MAQPGGGRPPRFSRRTRRRLRLLRTLTALSAGIWTVTAWVSSAGAPAEVRRVAAPAAPTAALPSTTVATSTTTTTAPPRPPVPGPDGPYRVGTVVLTFRDGNRPAPSRLGGAGPRTLVTLVQYPIDGNPSASSVDGARAATGRPFPLIVFAHGFGITPSAYSQLTTAWARSGYVVASPAFPGTAAANAPAPDENDLPNQVIDLAFVVSAMEQTSAAHTGPLSGAVDPGRVAVAGHSDGGETVAGLALDGCCVDPRIRASIIMAGAELTLPGPGGYIGTRHAPTLIIQGDADHTDNPRFDRQMFIEIAPPKWFLDLPAGDHETPFLDAASQWPVVARTTLDFLNWKVKGEPWAAARFGADGSAPAIAGLTGQG
jgi:dienelactone hydrolase